MKWCVKMKTLLVLENNVAKWLFNNSFKKIEAVTGGSEAVTGGVL